MFIRKENLALHSQLKKLYIYYRLQPQEGLGKVKVRHMFARRYLQQLVCACGMVVSMANGIHVGVAQLNASAAMPLGGAIRIMPLGDSITAGNGSRDHGGYRTYLQDMLRSQGMAVTFVGSQHYGPASSGADEGHPGARITDLSPHIEQWLTTYQPDIILLHIGTNDIEHHVPLGVVTNHLSHLLDTMTATLPTTLIIVAQITPLCHFMPQVQAYNAAIPALVAAKAAQGARIRWVNMYNAVPLHDLGDCVHPTDVGYQRMAQVWDTAITRGINDSDLFAGQPGCPWSWMATVCPPTPFANFPYTFTP